MRRDEVIRLQLLLPIIRTEIARIDFTPDYVLLVDRFHKEYIKASYKDVSFLADNGLSFYSLQALFWNQLFLPGEKTVGEQMLQRFTCSLTDVATTVPMGYKSGKIEYQWKASKATALITGAGANYESAGHGKSSLIWTYDNFRTFAGTVPTVAAVCRDHRHHRTPAGSAADGEDVVAQELSRLGRGDSAVGQIQEDRGTGHTQETHVNTVKANEAIYNGTSRHSDACRSYGCHGSDAHAAAPAHHDADQEEAGGKDASKKTDQHKEKDYRQEDHRPKENNQEGGTPHLLYRRDTRTTEQAHSHAEGDKEAGGCAACQSG